MRYRVFKFVHAPGRDIPVPVTLNLNQDLLEEIISWGNETLSDKKYWNLVISETLRRSGAWKTNRQISAIYGGLDVYDEYIFYFSNKEDAALFKLTWQ